MGDKTKIEWTSTTNADGTITPGSTWNPVRGCSRVSPGCENCYAERVAARFSGKGQPYDGLAGMHVKTRTLRRDFADGSVELRQVEESHPRWTGKVRLVEEHLNDPLRWRKPRRIFVNSMSDLFHEGLSNEDIDEVFGVMAACQYLGAQARDGHTFQVLTKRAARMRTYLEEDRRAAWAHIAARRGGGVDADGVHDQVRFGPRALPHVWLGVSVEDQRRVDERIPDLLATPAAVRFLSVEPLLGPVTLRSHLCNAAAAVCRCGHGHGFTACPNYGGIATACHHTGCGCAGFERVDGIDWVIVGAESGPGARPMHEDWVRSIRDQCVEAGVKFFYKQRLDGSKKVSLPVLDGRQWAEFPA